MLDIKELRSLLRSEYGKGKYRITSDGEVHIYGVMPNTNIIGWWFLGYLNDDNLIVTKD